MIKKWRGYDAIPSPGVWPAAVDVVATVGFDLDGLPGSNLVLVSLAHFRTQGRDQVSLDAETVEMRNMARLIRDTAITGGKPGQEAWLNKATLSVAIRGEVEFETMVKQYYKEGVILYIVESVKKSLRN
ncbi:hypothetical protein SPFM8_00069 [Salmonella phage SPFM8]|nr:hypothetical protein SPFM8_00069 [Salmonella phage SPFM8]